MTSRTSPRAYATRARESFWSAHIGGRGAFRRFKATLFEFPELRKAWFTFHDARMARRAVEWLRDEGLVDEDAAERASATHPDPELPEIAGPVDPEETARRVADELRSLYGARLRRVVLFGSWGRGDAHPESDRLPRPGGFASVLRRVLRGRSEPPGPR